VKSKKKRRLQFPAHPPATSTHGKLARAKPAVFPMSAKVILAIAIIAPAVLILWPFVPKPAQTENKPPVPSKPAVTNRQSKATEKVTNPASQTRAAQPTSALSNFASSFATIPSLDSGKQPLEQSAPFLQQAKSAEPIAPDETALKQANEDEKVPYDLGVASAKKGDADKAIKYFQEALIILPDYAEAHNQLASLLANQKRFEEANKHFDAALRISPEYASAHNNYGTALRLQARDAEAIQHYAEAVRISPNYVEARFNLAEVNLRSGKFDEAIRQFTEVLRLKPDFKPAAQGLAKAKQRQLPGQVRIEN
jgi:tetratricopeptide (TPR) repeat protein